MKFYVKLGCYYFADAKGLWARYCATRDGARSYDTREEAQRDADRFPGPNYIVQE